MNKLDELKYQCLKNTSNYYDQEFNNAVDYGKCHNWTLEDWNNKSIRRYNKRYDDRSYYEGYYNNALFTNKEIANRKFNDKGWLFCVMFVIGILMASNIIFD